MFSFVPDLYDYASKAAMAYSKRIGASYMVIREPVINIYDYHPAWQRYIMFDEAFDFYDQVLYLDADVVAGGPNIFDRYDSSGFYAVPVLDSDPNVGPGIMSSILRQVSLFDLDLATYFNSGVMLVDRNTRQKIRALQWKTKVLDYNKEDQPTINKIVQSEIGLKRLDWKFNCLLKRQDQLDRAKEAYFIHFLGKELFRAVRPVLGAW